MLLTPGNVLKIGNTVTFHLFLNHFFVSILTKKLKINIPENTKHFYNICRTSAQRLRRRRLSNIVQLFCVYWDARFHH